MVTADRIRQEVIDLERVVKRAERAITAARQRPEDQDLYMDSAALNIHDFYGGVERVFQQIATTIDGRLPTGQDWHRQLLQQMQTDLPELRPPVLSAETGYALDEFLRFRQGTVNHIVYNRLVAVRNIFFYDRLAELLTLVADIHTLPRDEFVPLLLPLMAERTDDRFIAFVVISGHCGSPYLFVRILSTNP